MITPVQIKKEKAPLYWGLINYFPRALTEVAKVSTFGAAKHQTLFKDKRWLDPDYTPEMYDDAIVRHVFDRAVEGEINEKDGGCYHLAQIAWDALARLEKLLVAEEHAG